MLLVDAPICHMTLAPREVLRLQGSKSVRYPQSFWGSRRPLYPDMPGRLVAFPEIFVNNIASQGTTNKIANSICSREDDTFEIPRPGHDIKLPTDVKSR
jgi:hypothetical protein